MPYTAASASKAAVTRARNKQREYERKIRSTAWDVSQAINELKSGDLEETLACFIDKTKELTPDDRYSVFVLLDEKPGIFPNYLRGTWYGRLRRVRNTPEVGERLFALFQHEEV